jgi:hypothetical protein
MSIRCRISPWKGGPTSWAIHGQAAAIARGARFCRATGAHAKPCSLDEDNTARLYLDADGWAIHRKRVWVATLAGCHYESIDFSIVAGQEAGTAASRRSIRSWMEHLSTFLHARDLVRGRPGMDWIREVPSNVVVLVARRQDGLQPDAERTTNETVVR